MGADGDRRGLRTRVTVGVAGAVALVAAGWFASHLFVSPEQREAAARPPEPVPIEAPVERGTLSEVITMSAEVGRAHRTTIALPAGVGSTSVVTKVTKKAGETIRSGDVIAEVNGRPVFAVAGRFPFYRDVAAGDTGPDVRQLQEGLAGVEPTGVLDQATADAVARLYKTSGRPVPEGAVLPLSEAIVVPLPSTVDSAPRIGDVVDGTASVAISSGAVVGIAAVPPAVAATLTKGLRGTVHGGDDAVEIRAVQTPDDPSADATVLITLPSRLQKAGPDALTFAFETSVVATDALIVPVTAVSHSGSRDTVLRVRDGVATPVAVTVQGTLNGRSAVASVDGGELTEHDTVLIG